MTLLSLIVFTLMLAAIPGPNVALIVANSIAHGRAQGLATVAGTTLGVALQLVLVGVGLALLVSTLAAFLGLLKWLGVLYLAALGVKALLTPQEALPSETPPRQPLTREFRQGFFVAVINPKTLLFNAAFLPQFIDPAGPVAAQFIVIGALFLTTLGLADALWALLAAGARPYIRRIHKMQNRLTGTLYLAAATGLALTRSS